MSKNIKRTYDLFMLMMYASLRYSFHSTQRVRASNSMLQKCQRLISRHKPSTQRQQDCEYRSEHHRVKNKLGAWQIDGVTKGQGWGD